MPACSVQRAAGCYLLDVFLFNAEAVHGLNDLSDRSRVQKIARIAFDAAARTEVEVAHASGRRSVLTVTATQM